MVIAMAVPRMRAVFLDRDGVLVIPEMRDGRSYRAPQSCVTSGSIRTPKAALGRLKQRAFARGGDEPTGCRERVWCPAATLDGNARSDSAGSFAVDRH